MSSERLRIVHVVESLEIGGLEHMVVALAARQLSAGHQVRIVCLWREGPLMARAQQTGIPVTCCNKKGGLDFEAIRKLRMELRIARANVLHTHNAMSHYYAVVASIGLRIRAIVSTRHGYGNRKVSGRGERLYRLAMHLTGKAVSVSKSLREHFVSGKVIPASKAYVIPNGIDLSGFSARSDERAQALRVELGLPRNAITFATVGRLNEVKRQIDLLRAMRDRLDAGDNACLILVGDGPMRPELESECDRLSLRPHLRMLGARNDVPALLAAMDVFVLCSRSEGYSLALVEASASALPIIATDVGGNAEIVADGVTGIVVPPTDRAALSAAMGRMYADTAFRKQCGIEAREWALREGSVEAMCQAYETLYNS